MSLLAKASRGPVREPFFMILYGVAGIGKSTFASKFEKPVFFDVEGGSKKLDVVRIHPRTFKEVLSETTDLLAGKYDFKTLVLDSLDHTETLIWEEVIVEYNTENKKRLQNIQDIPYGGGYNLALGKWKEFGHMLTSLRNTMNIILIAHSSVKTINDPSLPLPYDKHVIKLHQKSADYLKECVEAVLFANYEVFVSKKENERKARAVGEGKRILSTMALPAAEGKNRYGLPPQIDFDYDIFIRECESADPTDPKKISGRISHYLPQLKDEKVRAKATEAFEKAGENVGELLKIEQKLKTICETI